MGMSKLMKRAKEAFDRNGHDGIMEFLESLSPGEKLQLESETVDRTLALLFNLVLKDIQRDIEDSKPFKGFTNN